MNLSVKPPKTRLSTLNVIIPVCMGIKYKSYFRLKLSDVKTWSLNTLSITPRQFKLLYRNFIDYSKCLFILPSALPHNPNIIPHNQDRSEIWLKLWRPGQANNLAPLRNDVV
jgi:hypothetical protein